MLRDPEFMACLLVNGSPKFIRHSLVRNVPITDAVYCMKVHDWWFDTLQTEIPNFDEWWLLYKNWLGKYGLGNDAGSNYGSIRAETINPTRSVGPQ